MKTYNLLLPVGGAMTSITVNILGLWCHVTNWNQIGPLCQQKGVATTPKFDTPFRTRLCDEKLGL